MCGIAGTVGGSSEELARGLAATLRHRGPDDAGVLVDPGEDLALVATRLAILDIAGGHQPMETPDGALAIVFNGEIFNSPELRARLEREGCAFESSNSDTEVVLRLYERRGPALLSELNGMFAFVIHDRRRRRLFGARDRFGIKPLYYAQPGGRFAFASELRALLQVPGIERELDRESLGHYVSLRFVPGERSILAGVRRLPPGYSFVYDLERRALELDRWWRLAFDRDGTADREEWLARLREALGAAVERWRLSDVPIACSLSGGLDSSAIVGLLAERGGDVRTYSLGFAEEADRELSELELARAQAALHGTEHHEIVIGAGELLDDLLAMVWALDEPYGGGLPSWYVFRFMSRDVKVGLTGTGGDELFGNYRRFAPFEQSRLAPLARLAPALVRPFDRFYLGAAYYFSDREKRGLLVEPPAERTAAVLGRVFAESRGSSHRDAIVYLDLATQLPDEFLLMTDRFSMATSLEARTPFLDHELVELVASIPPELRTDLPDPKGLLRDAVADLLTPAHLEAPKRGFVLPLARWLREDLRPLAERLLSDEYLARQGLFTPGLAQRLLEPHLAGARDESERIWPLLMFQLWHLLYVEERLVAPPSFGWRDLIA